MDLFIGFTRTQLATSGFERMTTKIDGEPFVWWQKGDADAPTLVLIHGVSDQAGTWFQVASKLAETHRVLLVDLPGHGESGPATGPLKMSRVLGGLEIWLDARWAEKKVTLIGNSMGAWLSALVADRHPEWVEKTIWINGGPLRAEPQKLDGSDEPLDLLPKDREAARRLMSALRHPSSPPTPDPVLDDLVRRAMDGQVARMLLDDESKRDLESFLLDEARVAKLQPPVHVVWGEADRFMGRSYPDRLLKVLPSADLHLIPKCGHLPQAECSAALLETLRPLLPAPDSAFPKPLEEPQQP